MSDYALAMELAQEYLAKEGKLPKKEMRRGPTEDREVAESPKAEPEKKQ